MSGHTHHRALPPRCDVFIHCGDLTQYGGLPSFQQVIESINGIDAELKLMIAGNHDVDLDPAWLGEFAEDEDDLDVGAKCLSLLKSQQEKGIHYLDEGTHVFTLKDGRAFTVYATPYTPSFGEFAFLYNEEEDRFNGGPNMMPEDVDLVISHGSPAFPKLIDYKLDKSKLGEHCGCKKLAKALQRTRPRLACFGHIHEGRGTETVDWDSGELRRISNVENHSLVSKSKKGLETMLINAAVFRNGTGWLVDIEL